MFLLVPDTMGKFEKTLFDSVNSSIREQELVEIVREEPRIVVVYTTASASLDSLNEIEDRISRRFQEYSDAKLLFKNIVVAPHSHDRVAVKVEIRASTSSAF
jgi:RPA family protein